MGRRAKTCLDMDKGHTVVAFYCITSHPLHGDELFVTGTGLIATKEIKRVVPVYDGENAFPYELLKTLTDEQRLKAFAHYTKGYCVHCGRKLNPGELVCHCENDE